MRLFLLAILTFGLLAVLCGCATVEVSTENGHTLVAAENTSWNIFWCLPIGGGDCDDPNDDFCVWFRNTVSLENSMKLLDYARAKKGARTLKDVQTYTTADRYLFFVGRNAMHSSAELVY